jgi:hypothetical protein
MTSPRVKIFDRQKIGLFDAYGPYTVVLYKLSFKTQNRIYCHIEKSLLGPASGYLDFHLRGLDMKNVEPGPFGLGRSDPFFEIAKKDADHTTGQFNWNVVYRSEDIPNSLNPYWKPVRIGLEELCYGKLDWPLKIIVYDHNSNLQHKVRTLSRNTSLCVCV